MLLGDPQKPFDLSGLTQFDPSVLASVNFQYNVTGSGKPELTSSKSSQNYDYVQIDDTIDRSVEIETTRGAVLNASLNQSIDQNTRDMKYEPGVLLSDVTTPNETRHSADLLALLMKLIDNGDAGHNSATWQQALSQAHEMILPGAYGST